MILVFTKFYMVNTLNTVNNDNIFGGIYIDFGIYLNNYGKYKKNGK